MNKQYWIFDTDGTLTIPQHDFKAMKKECGLANDVPLLEGVLKQPEPLRTELLDKIQRWERKLAEKAEPCSDAVILLEELHKRGKHMAILTRNLRESAILTLKSANLLQYFPVNMIFGRECAKPKPDPDGIHKIMQEWRTVPNISAASNNPDKHLINPSIEHTVMVGDHDFDIEAGFRAGVTTVHVVRRMALLYHVNADVGVFELDELLE